MAQIDEASYSDYEDWLPQIDSDIEDSQLREKSITLTPNLAELG